MVIVCGDVGIGGLNLNGFPSHEETGAGVLESLSSGDRVTWATGPNGPKGSLATREEESVPNETSDTRNSDFHPTEPAAVYAPAAENTLGDGVAFGTGLGADSLQGTLESTAIFEIIRDNL
jgi:hypothetical protein